MAKRQPGQCIHHDSLDIVLGGDFHQLGYFADDVVDTHLRADGQIELGVAKILIFRHRARPDKPVTRSERHGHEPGWNNRFHQISNPVVEKSETSAQIIVVIIWKVLGASLQRKCREGARETEHCHIGRFRVALPNSPDVLQLRQI